MLTVVMSGLTSLQLANEPGVPYSAGRFSSLTAAAADMYLTHPRARLRASRRWLAAATAPAVGARASKWSTRSPGTGRGRTPRGDGVRAAPPLRHQPDRAFAGTLVWSYEVEPDGEGTLLTESHEVTRPVGRIGWLVIEPLLGAHDRSSDLRRGIANHGRGSRRRQRPSTGPADDHGVMVIFAGRRRGGAPLGKAFGPQVPSSPLSRSSGDQRSWRRGAR